MNREEAAARLDLLLGGLAANHLATCLVALVQRVGYEPTIELVRAFVRGLQKTDAELAAMVEAEPPKKKSPRKD